MARPKAAPRPPIGAHPRGAAAPRGWDPMGGIRNRPADMSAGRSDCRKTLEELERAKALSNFNRAQRHVRWAREDFCGGKSHFPEQKSFPCSFCARKSERFQQKLVGVAVAGEQAPPPQPVKEALLQRGNRASSRKREGKAEKASTCGWRVS